MIQLDKLSKKFITGDIETTALNEISLKIEKGEFVAIMGPSGCGKSTLMNIVGLLDRAASGQLIFDGNDLTTSNEKARATVRKENIGFVFQSFNLIDELSVFENVELPLIYSKTPKADRKKRVEEVLEKMEILHRKDHSPQQLSGGQQQRVAVARALVNEPKLILADEPTGNLDSKTGAEVMNLLKTLNEAGSTIMMVTHSEEDAKYASRIIRLKDGQID